MTHLDDGQLHAYLDGQSGQDGQTRQQMERHLAECAACRGRLEEARRVRDRARAILAGAGPANLTVPPFDAVVQRAARGGRTRRGFRPMVPLAWAASVALAVTVGWYARGLLRGGEAGSIVATREGDVRAAPIRAAPPATSQVAQAVPQRPETTRQITQSAADTTPIAAAAAPLTAPATNLAAAESKGALRAEARVPQGGSIMGRVVGAATQEPLSGIAVRIEGTQRQTVTAPDGSFQLGDVPAGPQRLRVTGVGYRPQAQDIAVLAGGTDTVKVAMQPTTAALEQVVVTGAAGVAAAGETWVTVSPSEAQRRLGGPLATIPGLPSLGTTVSGTGTSTVARTLQVLGTGLTIELIQRRGAPPPPPPAPTPARAAAPAPVAQAARGAGEEPGQALTVQWQGFSVTGRALIPPDSLRKLLQSLTAAQTLR